MKTIVDRSSGVGLFISVKQSGSFKYVTARKRTCESKSFFNEIRPYGRVKSTDGWVKSLRGEIPLRGVTDGFHFTRGRSPRISPKAPDFDFTAAGAAISLLFFRSMQSFPGKFMQCVFIDPLEGLCGSEPPK